MGKLFDDYNITDATYKVVDGHNIDLSILTRKDIKPAAGKHPLLLRYHGGFLITGSRLYPDWTAQWVLDYATAQDAIIVTADYRFLPEANGADVLEDVSSLFEWLDTKLPSVLSGMGLEADLKNIATIGESAGGYLAIQSAFLHSSSDRHQIKACIAQYPVLDVESPFFSEKYEKSIMGSPPMLPEKILDDHIRDVKAGIAPKVVSNCIPPGRMEICLATLQNGRYKEILGGDPKTNPFKNLEKAKGQCVPLFVLHGKQDSAVPVEGSVKFVEKMKQLNPSAQVLLELREGQHCFDTMSQVDDEWLAKALEWVGNYWPSPE